MALFSNVPENNNSMSFLVQLEVNDVPIFIVSNTTCIKFWNTKTSFAMEQLVSSKKCRNTVFAYNGGRDSK